MNFFLKLKMEVFKQKCFEIKIVVFQMMNNFHVQSFSSCFAKIEENFEFKLE